MRRPSSRTLAGLSSLLVVFSNQAPLFSQNRPAAQPDGAASPAFEVAPELLTNERPGAMIGELIGRYRIESLIGIGGMGEVYLARDEQLERKVALKFLPERLTADKSQLSRFKSEARTASALNHPNILTVYEIGQADGACFFATEFVDGVTLREALTSRRMKLSDVIDIAIQVASALVAAHAAGPGPVSFFWDLPKFFVAF